MNTSYCGKDCEKCRAENDHGCEGCKGGKTFRPGDCKIVDCVTSKGLDKCSDCQNKLSCSMIYKNDKLYGLERSGLAAKPVVESKGLGKWFTILFFISIGQLICSILDIDLVKNAFPVVGNVALGLSIICTVAYIAVCFSLNRFSDDFKLSAVTLIIGEILAIVAVLLALDNDFQLIAPIAGIIVLILSIVSKCYKFSACSEVTRSSDRGLSEQWESLRKWLVYLIIGFVTCLVLIFIPVLNIIAAIALLICSIAIIILAISEVVLFGMTMNHFNEIDKAAKAYKNTTEE
ncbi:MAG: DUF3795 domain-containing protein [Ruminococcus sp.]|nr:DUF3795 domain-containing protein [Ruminococcus sp.]